MVLGAALVVGRAHQVQRGSCVGSLAHAFVAAPTTHNQAMLQRAAQTMQYMLLSMQQHAVLLRALLPLGFNVISCFEVLDAALALLCCRRTEHCL